MTTILVVASITLLGSFLCSLFEAALYAVTPAQVEVMRNDGTPGAERLALLRRKMEEPIAAILTVNTITHTVGSAWCGAMVAEVYGSKAVGVFAGIFTLAVLLLTEIIPKSVGVHHAKTVGPLIAWPLQILVWSVWPIVKGTSFLMRLLHGGGEGPHPTEDEVRSLSRLAALGGELRQEEQRWIEHALLLDKVTAKGIMTPRTVVQTLPRNTPLSALAARDHDWRHSRIPLTEGDDVDRVTGFVHVRDLLEALLSDLDDGPATVADLERSIEFVPETKPAHDLLRLFLGQQQHIVAVLDEFGGFEGVLTLEDVLESLLGTEILDEHDAVADMRALARRLAARRHDDRAS